MIGLLTVVAAATGVGQAVPPANSIEYTLGGVMSSPLHFTIDLDTGDFILDEPTRITPRVIRHDEGRISADKADRLKALVIEAFRDGFVARRCLKIDGPPRINVDAMTDLRVSLNGRHSGAPSDPSCWSDTASKIQETAYDAVHETLRDEPRR